MKLHEQLQTVLIYTLPPQTYTNTVSLFIYKKQINTHTTGEINKHVLTVCVCVGGRGVQCISKKQFPISTNGINLNSINHNFREGRGGGGGEGEIAKFPFSLIDVLGKHRSRHFCDQTVSVQGRV